MPERSTSAVLQTNPREHQAVKAWGELRPARVEPERITVLYDERKTQVYKLHGVGPAESSVIAKRCRRRSAIIEQTLYEEVLPYMAVSGLRYFGSVEEPEGAYSWLFLEEARGKQYSPRLKEHRQLAAEWLGAVHGAAPRIPSAADLPDRSAAYYLEQLHAAFAEMQQGLANPVLAANPRHVALVRTMMSQMESLERNWSQVSSYCERMPQTLVHGDLMVKNVRVRIARGEALILIMDWETAGWGVPAIDLAQLGGRMSIDPDLTVYHSLIGTRWSSLSLAEIQRLAHLGGIFRLISAIRWATRDLPTHWVDDGIDDLRCYQQRLAPLIA